MVCLSSMVQKTKPENQSPGLIKALDYSETDILKNTETVPGSHVTMATVKPRTTSNSDEMEEKTIENSF